MTRKMPEEMGKSNLVPTHKNKKDIKSYNSYTNIKLMRHTKKRDIRVKRI